MLAALNFGAVGLGLGAGTLTTWLASLAATVLFGGVGGPLDAPYANLLVGIPIGFAVGGWVAGRYARHSERFHGAVTGLLLAGLIILVSGMGGGSVGTGSVLGLALLAAVISGIAGWLAGRRKRRPEA
jgi:hypothetical protein